jgi:hypothetical protein
MSPAERAREILEFARAADEPFSRAWQHAQREALRGVAGWHRDQWQVALKWAAPFFEAAYRGDADGLCGRRLDA